MEEVSFWVKTTKVGDYKKFIALATKCGYRFLDHGIKEPFEGAKGVGIFSRIPDSIADTNINNIEIKPYVCIIYFDEKDKDVPAKKVSMSVAEKRLISLDDDINKYIIKKLAELEKLIKKYSYLEIGDEVYTDMDVEYKWRYQPTYSYYIVKGYALFNDGWYVRTQKGYSTFQSLNLRDTKKVRRLKLNKIVNESR